MPREGRVPKSKEQSTAMSASVSLCNRTENCPLDVTIQKPLATFTRGVSVKQQEQTSDWNGIQGIEYEEVERKQNRNLSKGFVGLVKREMRQPIKGHGRSTQEILFNEPSLSMFLGQ